MEVQFQHFQRLSIFTFEYGWVQINIRSSKTMTDIENWLVLSPSNLTCALVKKSSISSHKQHSFRVKRMLILTIVSGYVHLWSVFASGSTRCHEFCSNGMAQVYIISTPENVHVQGVFVCQMTGSTPKHNEEGDERWRGDDFGVRN